MHMCDVVTKKEAFLNRIETEWKASVRILNIKQPSWFIALQHTHQGHVLRKQGGEFHYAGSGTFLGRS